MVNQISLKYLYRNLKNALRTTSEAPDFESFQILNQLFHFTSADILMDKTKPFSEEDRQRLLTLLSRRLRHEPLQYLLGSWEFFGRDFLVGDGVLIPRPDTEVLAEQVLKFLLGKKSPRVLELCGGSGCLAATIALEMPGAEVTSVEKSPEAFYYLQKNCENLHAPVRCVLGDAFDPDAAEGNFDCILSNPPYLTLQDMKELSGEVRREPEMALYGGEADGLFFYRNLTPLWRTRLNEGGMLAYEIGMGQHDAVDGILRTNGLKSICQIKDYSGIIRVLTALRQD